MQDIKESFRVAIASAAGPIAALAVWLTASARTAPNFRTALAVFVTLVLLMEIRVQLGERLPHHVLFYIHIASGTLLLGVLFYGSYIVQSSLLVAFAIALLFVNIPTGTLLLIRGFKTPASVRGNQA